MEPNEEKQRRKVHRSPSYPAVDLADAITKAEAVYNNEKRSATTPEVLASHMGYSTATGPGGRAVSALRQYGLIEEAGGKYRLSDLGYTLIHFSRHSEEWKAAILDAVRRPTLFRELLEEYPDGLPSDATLRNDLLKREFNPASIQDVVGIFRNTMSLVDFADVVHNEAGDQPVHPKQTNEGASQQRPRNQAEITQMMGLPHSGSFRQDVFSLAEGPVTIQWPASLSSDSIQDLADWLKILERKIKRSVKAGTPAAEE